MTMQAYDKPSKELLLWRQFAAVSEELNFCQVATRLARAEAGRWEDWLAPPDALAQ